MFARNIRRSIYISLLAMLVVFVSTSLIMANDLNEQCFDCHGAKQEQLKDTVHDKNACVHCHSNIDEEHIKSFGTSTDKKESKKIAEQSCATCHSSAVNEYEGSVHHSMGLSCNSCHGDDPHSYMGTDADNSPVNSKNLVDTCGSCHTGVPLQSYKESFHGRAAFLGSSESATCASCHGSHNILGPEDPNSRVALTNIPNTCAECHVEPMVNFASNVEHKLLDPDGPGSANYWTLKFFTWLTILTVIGLVAHIQIDLFYLLRARRK